MGRDENGQQEERAGDYRCIATAGLVA